MRERHTTLLATLALGFLAASMGLYQRLTARELLRFVGDLYGLERAQVDRRIEELLRQAQVAAAPPGLGEGMTPLLEGKRLAEEVVGQVVGQQDARRRGLDVAVAQVTHQAYDRHPRSRAIGAPEFHSLSQR